MSEVNHSAMKLGKRPAVQDSRTLRLSNYLLSYLPPPPDNIDYSNGIQDFGMMLNDQLGDCTIAAIGHAIQIWTAARQFGSEVTVPDEIIKKYYSLWDGYVPGDASTDCGGVELDVLKQWRNSDFAGYKLLAFADPAPGDMEHVMQAVYLFGGLYIGLELPESAQEQEVWDVPKSSFWDRVEAFFSGSKTPSSAPGSWGGHAVFVCGYDDNGLTCITWGKLKRMTWPFWHKYCDEAHALLSDAWLSQNPATGFDLESLTQDLKFITG